LIEQHPRLKPLNKNKNYIASSIIILNNNVDILGVSIGSAFAFQIFGESIELTIYTAVVTLSLLYLATLFPKLFAASHADTVLRYTGLIIITIFWIFRPVVAVLYSPIRFFVKDRADKGISQVELDAL